MFRLEVHTVDKLTLWPVERFATRAAALAAVARMARMNDICLVQIHAVEC